MSKKLAALKYYGGKSPRNRTGPWIASLLPQGQTYVEAFAGMAGVLLSRQPVASEVLNDADGHLINWWRMVRDEPKELGRLVHYTPWSRTIYEESHDRLTAGELDDDPLKRALAYHVCIQQGIVHGLGEKGWGAIYADYGGRKQKKVGPKDIDKLSARLAEVQLENCDAVDMVGKCAKYKDLVLYLDPPVQLRRHPRLPQGLAGSGRGRQAHRGDQGLQGVRGYQRLQRRLGSPWLAPARLRNPQARLRQERPAYRSALDEQDGPRGAEGNVALGERQWRR